MIRLLMLFLFQVTSTVFAGGSEPWPVISEIEREYQFDNPSRATVDLEILDQEGTPKYKLECHNYLYDAGTEFTYSGDFECRLASLYSEEYVSTLFAYSAEQSADWESRAIFYASHFIGECRVSPFGGKARIFRLRNMRITLEIHDESIKLAEEGNKVFAEFDKFSFRVSVARDSVAERSIADDVSPDELPKWFHRPSMCLTGSSEKENTPDANQGQRF